MGNRISCILIEIMDIVYVFVEVNWMKKFYSILMVLVMSMGADLLGTPKSVRTRGQVEARIRSRKNRIATLKGRGGDAISPKIAFQIKMAKHDLERLKHVLSKFGAGAAASTPLNGDDEVIDLCSDGEEEADEAGDFAELLQQHRTTIKAGLVEDKTRLCGYRAKTDQIFYKLLGAFKMLMPYFDEDVSGENFAELIDLCAIACNAMNHTIIRATLFEKLGGIAEIQDYATRIAYEMHAEKDDQKGDELYKRYSNLKALVDSANMPLD